MRVFGALLITFGFLISLSIVGAIIGIPMILIGIVCLIAGGRRKTIITNVVNVNTPEPRPQPEDWGPVERDHLFRRNEPKLIDATPVPPDASRGRYTRHDHQYERIRPGEMGCGLSVRRRYRQGCRSA